MKRLTILIIPENASQTKQLKIPKFALRSLAVGSLFLTSLLGYLVFDYIELRSIRTSYKKILAENQGLKGEARLLMSNLDEVKNSLQRVQDYSEKLGDLTQLKVKKFSRKTGIGPLTPEEFRYAEKNMTENTAQKNLPLGIDMDKLVFRSVFDRVQSIGNRANRNALEMQKLLSTLSQQRSLLSSIPSATPVDGWITSGFGPRISPFTGQKTMHKGIDVAAPMGTPIYAPADGVVIFSGAKAGFGNFIMIAHGYGVVSRFGHNAQNMVQPGQKVKRGDQIATVGMTGRSTGPHLHYEILVNGRYSDPKKFILDIQ
ncbi:M23 family metallopeptidase [Pseudobacteriovorax antillogorgiicola]|uniref:Murein DD-endopeptidase MepM and murein hydrolase activator NlpD, contain LysM domain n=1 Tax=Pseudobacteriovorax antillogorgiicola TaxID=1513793 RepID=A0A1Y6B424_9BACT|nr:M23 family metallopeptidase [Pseudobacteriovorax antillogorgiicola]TCS59191.1 murein DD-endopeptidase MepM/ murein hydrolase activator NlpD [Pseudobacteriovorax antillogorgiicola]SME90741.1 Murein DD-endopeptidase MepM and murein hydrolase activator NlpD, contain LysM domain [Pseudobacteriovorax antillogorgiicola]